jgi:hypothetical protein
MNTAYVNVDPVESPFTKTEAAELFARVSALPPFEGARFLRNLVKTAFITYGFITEANGRDRISRSARSWSPIHSVCGPTSSWWTPCGRC